MQVIYVGRLFWAFTVVEVVGAPGALCREWAAKSSSEDLCHWGHTTGGGVGCWVLGVGCWVLGVRTAVSSKFMRHTILEKYNIT
jgi:hypothetical protein